LHLLRVSYRGEITKRTMTEERRERREEREGGSLEEQDCGEDSNDNSRKRKIILCSVHLPDEQSALGRWEARDKALLCERRVE
jgi:hypothetical protein